MKNFVANFIEGMSIEDNGEGVMFHIFVPNIQSGVNIDYKTGTNWDDVPKIVEKVQEPIYTEKSTPSAIVEEPPPVQKNVFYKNYTVAREARAAPIKVGNPNCDTKFDRDDDGCEP